MTWINHDSKFISRFELFVDRVPREGTGTWPDYLANRADQKNEGPFGGKIPRKSRNSCSLNGGGVEAHGQLTPGPNVPSPGTKYKRSKNVNSVELCVKHWRHRAKTYVMCHCHSAAMVYGLWTLSYNNNNGTPSSSWRSMVGIRHMCSQFVRSFW